MQIAADYGWEEGDAASLCAVFSTAFPQFTQPFLSIFCSHWYQAHYTGDEKMSLDQITWDLEGFKVFSQLALEAGDFYLHSR